jgi:hypothetical protein
MAVGDKIAITLFMDVTGDAGPDYGHEEVTPEWVAAYLRGAGGFLVPGVVVDDAVTSVLQAPVSS